MFERRAFLQRAAVAAAAFGLPLRRAQEAFAQNEPLPPHDLYASDPEKYWTECGGNGCWLRSAST